MPRRKPDERVESAPQTQERPHALDRTAELTDPERTCSAGDGPGEDASPNRSAGEFLDSAGVENNWMALWWQGRFPS